MKNGKQLPVVVSQQRDERVQPELQQRQHEPEQQQRSDERLRYQVYPSICFSFSESVQVLPVKWIIRVLLDFDCTVFR
jgi:hypothetical protein